MPRGKVGELLVGGPSVTRGEVGAALEVGELQAFARDHLAAYKIPRHLTALSALPRNNTSKILKRDLRNHEKS